MGNRIRSERLCLRQMEVEEARALLQGKGDPERPWMAGYPMQGTLIAVEAFVRALDNGADPGVYGVYQLVRSGDAVVNSRCPRRTPLPRSSEALLDSEPASRSVVCFLTSGASGSSGVQPNRGIDELPACSFSLF